MSIEHDNSLVIKAKHYNSHPSGIECREIVQHLNGNLFNSIKYMWRYKDKGTAILDLEKAAEYINWEIGVNEMEPLHIKDNAIGNKFVLNNYPTSKFVEYFSPDIREAFLLLWDYLDLCVESARLIKVHNLTLKFARACIQKEISILKAE